jgi:tetratricopeptide (TPR) repeat protein
LLFKEKDFEEAIKFIEESSKNNEDPEIFYKLGYSMKNKIGIILCKLNRFEESIK